jgi:hypothetical protein
MRPFGKVHQACGKRYLFMRDFVIFITALRQINIIMTLAHCFPTVSAQHGDRVLLLAGNEAS